MTRRPTEKIGKWALRADALNIEHHPVHPRREQRAAEVLARLARQHGGKARRRSVARLGRRALRWAVERHATTWAGHYGSPWYAVRILDWGKPHRRGPLTMEAR